MQWIWLRSFHEENKTFHKDLYQMYKIHPKAVSPTDSHLVKFDFTFEYLYVYFPLVSEQTVTTNSGSDLRVVADIMSTQ